MMRNKVLGFSLLLLLWYVFCLPATLFDVPYSTVVGDKNGDLLGARIAEDKQWRFPASDSVPEKFAVCIIAFEDKYFHVHWGVNVFSIFRAAKQNIVSQRIVSGGSTISMQTIRLARKEKRTYIEKVIELIWATRLEFRHSKKEILAMYASHAPFGGNVVGLEAAAWRYFGHSSANLSWAESATLAVLPNAPSIIHLAKNRSRLLEKRNRLLRKLYEHKKIDESTYELALTEALPQEPLPLPQIAPHLVTYFYKNKKGENIRSTIDKGLQLQVENILLRWNNVFASSEIKNIAALVIDVHKNEVLAYCGNVNFENQSSGNQVDVIRAPRSSGSILKPFLYCAALQEGDLLPNMLLPDIPLNINGFTPQNFNRQFDGAVPASEALSRSLNIPSVYSLRNYSVPKFYNVLKKIGLTTLSKPSSHYGLSLILGGAEANLWDISAAYTMMASTLNDYQSEKEQVLEKPHLLLAKEESTKLVKTFEAGAIWQTFEALKEVNRPEEIDWRYISSMQDVAWKTGTSYGFRDAWAVGATPRYVVGVWVGNANGEGKPGLTGARTAGPVMFDLLNILPSSKWFEQPYNEFVEAEVCRQSGHLKGIYCEDTDSVLICPQGLKTSPCPYHVAVNVSNDERYRVFENCAGLGGMKQKTWFVLPPAWAWFYKQGNPSYRNLPPLKADCGHDGSFQPMQFIYPQQNASIILPKQMDGRMGEIVFELAHSQSDALVFWHLDDVYVGSTEHFHRKALAPSSGKHSITTVDNEGNSLSISVEVRRLNE